MRATIFILLLASSVFGAGIASKDASWKKEYRIESAAFFSIEDLRRFWEGAEFKKEKQGVCGGVECFAVLIGNQHDGSRTSFFVYRKTKFQNEDLWEVVASRHAIPAGADIEFSKSGITLLSAQKKPLISLAAESLRL